jgi:peroxiredoxin Q/BCP
MRTRRLKRRESRARYRISAAKPFETLGLLVLTMLLLLLATVTHAHADMLDEGAEFPAWELTDHSGAKVSSGDYAGKRYLLWYYPMALTPGCTAEARGLRDEFAELSAAGVEILGVSFDEPSRNAAFVEAEELPFRLLSDTERKLAPAVGAAGSASDWAPRRISYLVGEDGKVLKAYGKVSPSRHAGEVLEHATSLAR